MADKNRFKAVREKLAGFGQEHLLAFYPQLGESQQESLLSQIESLDLAVLKQWIDKYVVNPAKVKVVVPDSFEPAPFYPARSSEIQVQEKYDRARRTGEKLLSAGRVGAFVVAGGQGTRLGFDGPKGDFPISCVKNKTLFRIFAETIAAAGKKYDNRFCWYVMTSPMNYSATVEIFEANNYYGFDKSDIYIFWQGTLPNFSFDGKILLADKSTISASPDGHGGSLKALYDSAAVEHMRNRGIDWLSYWQVDNPLANIFDPLFTGLHAMDDSEMSSRALMKVHPAEKIGNFCLADGKIRVIEYSDLPDEYAHRKRPDGSLVFESGSIGIHIISRAFVERLNSNGFALPLHRVVKKIPHIDAAGNFVEPEKPNGIKLEMFVFDALPLADNAIILETLRAEEFAPVKNRVGDDGVEVTRRMMIERAASWLEYTGLKVPRKADGTADCVIEIAPSFALDREDVKAKAKNIPAIRPGDKVYLE